MDLVVFEQYQYNVLTMEVEALRFPSDLPIAVVGMDRPKQEDQNFVSESCIRLIPRIGRVRSRVRRVQTFGPRAKPHTLP